MIPLAACLLLLQVGARPGEHAPGPGPRAPLAGLSGLQVVSKLDFGGASNRLTAVYVFPDRARWHFEESDPKPDSPHQLYYRSGEVLSLLSGASSTSLEGEERDLVLLQMELRRAVLLWPDGFEWAAEENGTRSAPVFADSCCRERRLGRLVATLEGERGVRIDAEDGGGRRVATLEIVAWQDRGGRSWPRTLAAPPDSGGFSETIESIETRVHYLELSFLAPDRRPVSSASAGEPALLAHDLVAMTYASHPLPPGSDWDSALAEARRLVRAAAVELEGSGWKVDPLPTLELSSEGRPVRCLVRLSVAVRPPPAGYETRSERAGLFCPLRDLRAVDAALIGRLIAAAPEGANLGAPYLRVHEGSSLPVELVLPIEPPD